MPGKGDNVMKLRKLCCCFLLVLALLPRPWARAEEEEVFDPSPWESVETLSSVEDVASRVGAAVLMERETGTCLYEHNPHDRMAPASVTKIMTMLLVCEALDGGSLTEETRVRCSAYAAGMGGSQIFLKEGEEMSVGDLLKSVAVASANDAAVALAEEIAGSEGEFVRRMNRRAAELGMADTRFANCTGLPASEEHLTSAWDIALMSRELLGHDRIRAYTSIWTDSVRDGAFGLANTNKLVRFYEGCTGLKTGFTQEAMYCLSASARRDGTEYIAVILHAETSAERFEAAKLLLNHAFALWQLVDALPDGALPPVAVALGKEKYIQPVMGTGTKLLIKKTEAAALRKELALPESVEAPVAAGQELGCLRLLDGDGRELMCLKVVAPAAVERLGWGRLFLLCLRALAGGQLP